ncbi:hypothetical protein BN2475_530026 [Paraburkholderia ribeironis]|uniref:Uncharacterized protein n=1 Tax=Paraburkholderia ribeironis TaxID=1247936 RepID=A0A1N7SCM9_9BURK|nr:hypothetical protein [Paraburkholderia ribeironis]SIT45130.1 hypothetical protein BN2475_530026 [Paraburkholderia ribeironis]
MPNFDYGSNNASLDLAKIDKQIDVADYESAIQTAFKEVSNAVTLYKVLGDSWAHG